MLSLLWRDVCSLSHSVYLVSSRNVASLTISQTLNSITKYRDIWFSVTLPAWCVCRSGYLSWQGLNGLQYPALFEKVRHAGASDSSPDNQARRSHDFDVCARCLVGYFARVHVKPPDIAVARKGIEAKSGDVVVGVFWFTRNWNLVHFFSWGGDRWWEDH